MARKNYWLGMLVMVLVFGMSVMGCDDGSSDQQYYDVINGFYNTTSPNENDFSGTLITFENFNTIKNFNSYKFFGWQTYQRGSSWELTMVWTGLNQSEKASIQNSVRENFTYYSITTRIDDMDIRPTDLIINIAF